MQIGSRPRVATPDLQALQDQVQRQLGVLPVGVLPVGVQVRQVTRAANAWSSAAIAEGLDREAVATALDGWAATMQERSSAVLVRVGLRLHGASQFRFH